MCSNARVLIFSFFIFHSAVVCSPLSVVFYSGRSGTTRPQAHPAAVGLVPGYASLPYFAALRLSQLVPLLKIVAALVPARTAFGALHIPNATKPSVLLGDLGFVYWFLGLSFIK
jgi:hypothetical protein